MAFTEFNLKDNPIGFWAGIGILNIVGLILLNLITFQNAGRLNPGAVIFTLMYVSFHALQFQLLRQQDIPLVDDFINSQFSDPKAMAFTFLVGFFGWYTLLASRGFSFLGDRVQSFVSLVPAVPQNVLLSQATQNIQNVAFKLFINVISAGFVEEAFFYGLMPALIIFFLWRFGITNRFVLLVGATVGSAALFASFHQQTTAFTEFWFAAFTFGVILRGTALSDFLVDSVPGAAVFASFVVGAHIGNNMFVSGGIRNFVSALSAEPLLLGLTLLVFGVYVVWSVDYVFEKLGMQTR